MVSLQDIKERARQVKQKASRSDDNLGPDRGTRDQLEARKERARMEAKKEAQREKRKEEVKKAREQAREEAKQDSGGSSDSAFGRVVEAIDSAADAVDDGDGERLDDIGTAMQTDFDEDGEPLGAELGVQTQSRAQAENESLSGLSENVERNTREIDRIDKEVSGGANGGSLEDMGFGGDGAGFGGQSLEDMGFEVDNDNNGGLF